MLDRFGAFLVIEVAELTQDKLLTEDSPYLPEFEVVLETDPNDASRAALEAVAKAISSVSVKYRSPMLSRTVVERSDDGAFAGLNPDIGLISIRFAPIYRQPDSDAVYPCLLYTSPSP